MGRGQGGEKLVRDKVRYNAERCNEKTMQIVYPERVILAIVVGAPCNESKTYKSLRAKRVRKRILQPCKGSLPVGKQSSRESGGPFLLTKA